MTTCYEDYLGMSQDYSIKTPFINTTPKLHTCISHYKLVTRLTSHNGCTG